MKRLFKNKRGNWQDILEYSRGILILGFSILIGFILLYNFNAMIISSASTNDLLNDSNALSSMQGAVNVYPGATDYIIPFLYVVFLGFSVWSARLIQSSNKFLFIGIIMLLVVTLFSLFVETVWEEFVSNPSISFHITSFPITNFMISYLRYFVILYGIFVGVALYSKND